VQSENAWLAAEASIVLFCWVFNPWGICCDHVPRLAALLRLTAALRTSAAHRLGACSQTVGRSDQFDQLDHAYTILGFMREEEETGKKAMTEVECWWEERLQIFVQKNKLHCVES
jgi:1,2-phenylacetyl-CoA epoxidase catalytic subunit